MGLGRGELMLHCLFGDSEPLARLPGGQPLASAQEKGLAPAGGQLIDDDAQIIGRPPGGIDALGVRRLAFHAVRVRVRIMEARPEVVPPQPVEREIAGDALEESIGIGDVRRLLLASARDPKPHVLEQVLRVKDRRTMTAVAERIRRKIGWRPSADERDEDFLSAFYAGLRGRLEGRLLFGHRRRDKLDHA